MLTHQNKFSQETLENCHNLADDLVDGTSDLFKTFTYLAELAKKQGCPFNEQRFAELRDLFATAHRQCALQLAEIDAELQLMDDRAEALELYQEQVVRKEEKPIANAS